MPFALSDGWLAFCFSLLCVFSFLFPQLSSFFRLLLLRSLDLPRRVPPGLRLGRLFVEGKVGLWSEGWGLELVGGLEALGASRRKGDDQMMKESQNKQATYLL